MRLAKGGGPLFPIRALADTLRPRVGPPRGHFKMEMSALSWGGHWASYLLPGIWLKCAPFHSPRVPLCALACHYLQMRDFTLVGHVNRDCDANFMDSSKGKFALLPPHPPSQPSVPVAPFVPSRTYIHTKLLGLIRSPPTTLWGLIIDCAVPKVGDADDQTAYNTLWRCCSFLHVALRL